MSTPTARKTSLASSRGRVDDLGPLGDDGRGDLVDVAAAVAVLGCGLAQGAGQQRAAEAVDLGAVVVEVVLAGDLGAGHREDPAQRVADRGPPHAADVQRTGRVGRDELEVDLLAGEGVGGAVAARLPRRRRRRPGPGRAAATVMLMKPGSGHVDRGDAVGLAQARGEQLGEGPRVGAGLLGQLQRDVGGVVAVRRVARSLHRDLGRDAVGQRQRAPSTSDARASTTVAESWAGFTSQAYRRAPVSFASVPAGSVPLAPLGAGLRSSGDRALVSGTRCRRFESCRRRPARPPGRRRGGAAA